MARTSAGPLLLLETNRDLPLVSVSVALRTGAIEDPPGAEGAVRLLARLMRRSADGRSAEQNDQLVEGMGATLGAEVSASTVISGYRHPGEQTTRLFFATKKSAPSPPGTWFLCVVQISFVSAAGASWGRKRKTPPEHRLGRGSGNRTGTASGHSASARKHALSLVQAGWPVLGERMIDE
jgi:hypothetical protein